LGKKSEERDDDDINDNTAASNMMSSSSSGGSSNSGMVGVSGMVDSMANLKRAQRAGKVTARLLQELSSTTVEGSAADGKIKVVFDCQQRPMSVNIDQGYFESTDVTELCSSLTSAMNDAHSKSLERMDEKMKTYYSDLGLFTQ